MEYSYSLRLLRDVEAIDRSFSHIRAAKTKVAGGSTIQDTLEVLNAGQYMLSSQAGGSAVMMLYSHHACSIDRIVPMARS